MRAFPVIYTDDVARLAGFYQRLGFAEQFRLPAEGEPGYIGLARDGAELAIVSSASPRELIGVTPGIEPRFELFVYVPDVDAAVRECSAAGAPVLREAQDMFWGERVGYVADPDGNPVALATR